MTSSDQSYGCFQVTKVKVPETGVAALAANAEDAAQSAVSSLR